VDAYAISAPRIATRIANSADYAGPAQVPAVFLRLCVALSRMTLSR